MKSTSSIALVGIGGIFPHAPNPATLWDIVHSAVDTAEEPPSGRWALPLKQAFAPQKGQPDHVYSRRACFVDQHSVELNYARLNISAELVAQLDPVFQLLLHAGTQAFFDAALDSASHERIGVIAGNLALPTDTSARLAQDYLGRTLSEQILSRSVTPSSTAALNRFITGLPAAVLAQALGLGGICFTLDAACASSLYAIKLAAEELRSGRADVMLAGGVARPDSLYTQMGFSQLRALSPTGTCAPFDRNGDGLVVGEGAGMVVLKRTADAVRDGDHIYATIEGIGLSNDIGGSLLAPTSEGQLRAMRAAYAQAGWDPRTVEYIECHATGTPVGDAVEVESLHQLWAQAQSGTAADVHREQALAQGCVLGSVKSNIGHLLTAAGAAALIKTLLALKHKTLPPTANFATPGELLSTEGVPFKVLSQAQKWERRDPNALRRAGVSAFGFGGINAHVLLQEWDQEEWDQERCAHIYTHEKSSQGDAPSSVGFEPMRDADDAIAIVGIDVRSGASEDTATFRHQVFTATTQSPALHPPQHWGGAHQSRWWKDEGFTPCNGAYLHEISIPAGKFRIPPTEMGEMLPRQALMLLCAEAALEDAGAEELEHTDTGVFIGTGLDLNATSFSLRWQLPALYKQWQQEGINDLPPLEALQDILSPALSANRTMGALGSIVASRIARAFGVGGPSFTFASEENSGLHALRTALDALQRKEINLAIVGAVDMPGDIRAQLSNQRLGRDLRVNDGACALILKRVADARAAGDTMYALIDAHAEATGADTTLLKVQEHTRTRALEQLQACNGAEITAYRFSETSAPDGSVPGAEQQAAPTTPFTLPATTQLGHAGEASGLLAVVKTALALHAKVLPPRREKGQEVDADYWLHNAAAGARRALVEGIATGGQIALVALREAPTADADTTAALPARFPLAKADTSAGDATLVRIYAADAAGIGTALKQLQQELHLNTQQPLAQLACRWDTLNPPDPQGLCLTCVATTHTELEAQLDFAAKHLERTPGQRLDGKGGARIPACARDKVFYSPTPLAAEGKVAFVFPGSGNHFVNMGREFARTWPEVFERQHRNNNYLQRQFRTEMFWNGAALEQIEADHNSMILAHVALCTALSDRVRLFGVEPHMAVGYSLGESSSLFSLGVWRERDTMLERIEESPLFTRDLAGPCVAARTLWQLPEDEAVDWYLGIVPLPAAQIKPHIEEVERAYLLIVNTAQECVIGGQRHAVEQVLHKLGNPPFIELNGVTTVHCPVPQVVAEAYHALHRFETHAVATEIFSCASGTPYAPSTEACADAILAQATDTIDFTRVVNNAYAGGARIFIESGSGNSCTRMLTRILGDRPHMVRPTCVEGQPPLTTFATLIAQLEAEGVRCNIADLRPLVCSAQPHRTETSPSAPRKNTMKQNMVKLYNGIEQITLPPRDTSEGTKHSALPPLGSIPPQSKKEEVAPKTNNCPCATPSVAQHNISGGGSNAVENMSETMLGVLHSMQQMQVQHSTAHSEFLRLRAELHAMMAENFRLQQEFGADTEAMGISAPEWHSSPEPVAPPTAQGQQVQPSTPSVAPSPLPEAEPPLFDRAACMEFAIGSIGKMLGPQFASIDAHPTRVRLPDEPLMLVDRILLLEGEPCSMGAGRVVTEHDVTAERWYLDGGHIPTCVAVEAGQADLFLSAYLGADLQTKGKAVYRLLDAVVKFHDSLPQPGDVIRYDIYIERFFRQGDTWLFRFNYESSVNGKPLMSMRDGCAGFFTQQELNAGRGVVHTALDLRPMQGKRTSDWNELVPLEEVEQYSASQIQALRRGDLAACFGPEFARLTLQNPYTLPGGNLELVDRVIHMDPTGGRYGIGQIKAEMDIQPDDWFLTCHFCDDNVMPGTLMYECCLHTLRVFLMRMGWVTAEGEGHWEPIPGIESQLKCRGQVTEKTKVATFEVNIKEIGYRPEPYAIVDALMYADSKAIVEITNMTIQLSGLNRAAMEARWSGSAPIAGAPKVVPAQPSSEAQPAAEKKPPLFDYASILAFSNGNPSDAFGERYRIFDAERRIARLPRPPFQFLDRIIEIDATQWEMVAGGSVAAQYDVPQDGWFFAQERSHNMPFSILLEIALQPCGWLAAYVGSALTSEVDLCFRNLDGTAQILRPLTNMCGTLTTRAKLTRVSSSGGMIIQNYDFEVADNLGPVYRGDTVFGFFSEQALANQVGIPGAKPYQPQEQELQRNETPGPYPVQAPFPDVQLRMVDEIELYIRDGGPHGLGFIRARKIVNPDEWFFAAHFYQDPVCPGSLGLESFIQLIKYAAVQRWGGNASTTFETTTNNTQHHWSYRGQIIPSSKEIHVEASISAIDDGQRQITADGYLLVDGKTIYSMQDFCVKLIS
ncbi:MAG: beta-ketoacyl synthase N-terminal-like domain-containing protein [Desulfuromonadaceae bacterium]|nr:beta-ketoacyl synthase N-terminal-like domain-containing protein [Desulfuromonadaceae bacterium]